MTTEPLAPVDPARLALFTRILGGEVDALRTDLLDAIDHAEHCLARLRHEAAPPLGVDPSTTTWWIVPELVKTLTSVNTRVATYEAAVSIQGWFRTLLAELPDEPGQPST